MSSLEAIILGIIQGLTEFLPVSSSGHLELAKALFGDDSMAEDSLMFTVVVHFATALSTVVVFKDQIAQIFRGLFQFKLNDEFYFSVKIVLSMIPATIIGLFFIDQIETLFNKQIILVGAMLLITGGLLFVADLAQDTKEDVSWKNALLIGIAQAIAILPGISRSGATISTSVLLGVDRTKAAIFSFLMVVPLIFGKIAKDLLDGGFVMEGAKLEPLGLGFVSAFITGIIACKWMIGLVRSSKLKYFAFYCFVIGSIALVLGWIN